MSIRGKIAATIISPLYFVFLIGTLLIVSILKLLFGTLNLLGITEAIEFWLIKTRQLFVMWEFQRKLSKEDRAVMNSKD